MIFFLISVYSLNFQTWWLLQWYFGSILSTCMQSTTSKLRPRNESSNYGSPKRNKLLRPTFNLFLEYGDIERFFVSAFIRSVSTWTVCRSFSVSQSTATKELAWFSRSKRLSTKTFDIASKCEQHNIRNSLKMSIMSLSPFYFPLQIFCYYFSFSNTAVYSIRCVWLHGKLEIVETNLKFMHQNYELMLFSLLVRSQTKWLRWIFRKAVRSTSLSLWSVVCALLYFSLTQVKCVRIYR